MNVMYGLSSLCVPLAGLSSEQKKLLTWRLVSRLHHGHGEAMKLSVISEYIRALMTRRYSSLRSA